MTLVAEEPIAEGAHGLPVPIAEGGTLSRSFFFFERGRRLGAGTSGEVYVARSQETSTPGGGLLARAGSTIATAAAPSLEIAAKLMQRRGEAAKAALREEIRLMKLLSHTHVVRYLTFATGSGLNRKLKDDYILMEFCAGGSVGQLLRARGGAGLPSAQLHEYGVQLLRGLDFLHENMVIHRDLKGDNVLLQSATSTAHRTEMVVKIADFGSATTSEETDYYDVEGSHDQPGEDGHAVEGQDGVEDGQGSAGMAHIAGSPCTPQGPEREGSCHRHCVPRLFSRPAALLSPIFLADWMAPEHIKGAAGGRKADIWSYAGVLLEMMTGRPPWYEEHQARAGGFAVFQLLFRIAESDGPPPMPAAESMPAGLHELLVLLACFERDVTKRPNSKELLRKPWVTGQLGEALTRLVVQTIHDPDGAARTPRTLAA